MTLWLSRIRLGHAPDLAALAGLLLPEEENARIAAAHRLLWSLFADGPDRNRDFLWREDGGSATRRKTFLTLSARKPEDRRGLFALETKEFTPALAVGQRLRFRLRAAPSRNLPSSTPGERGTRVDPVWHKLRQFPREERAARRFEVEHEVMADWLARQGETAGFRLVMAAGEDGGERAVVSVDGDLQRRLAYDQKRLRDAPRKRPLKPNPKHKRPAIAYSTFDLEGELIVDKPDEFLARLGGNLARVGEPRPDGMRPGAPWPPPVGFGRAKAFGCGLMLIRRA